MNTKTPAGFKVIIRDGQEQIFDIIRKKYVALTPEEWVRQKIIHYLVHERNYPRSLLAVEKGIVVNNMQYRCDIVAYNNLGKPYLIIECKAPGVKLTQDAFDQIARYNMGLKVPFLMVTNSSTHYICRIDWEKKSYAYLDDLPDIE